MNILTPRILSDCVITTFLIIKISLIINTQLILISIRIFDSMLSIDTYNNISTAMANTVAISGGIIAMCAFLKKSIDVQNFLKKKSFFIRTSAPPF